MQHPEVLQAAVDRAHAALWHAITDDDPTQCPSMPASSAHSPPSAPLVYAGSVFILVTA
ncbi:MAG: hypothetical protein AVDCRST_MAG93-1607 [uncultured Chloroflexia bacterium]|uniref:Uncharacterized protein n=1 Tax=uncultured Chloroflexia bacterium TaxID=1672391 RepID=A0A6J4IBZ2_9CHLR|nr:MAG: hypothetical protein AVDCRST_MAG93-1607 [uncultured Chloroflexia bacterium]